MHNSRQSFVERQRMLDHDGDASNQVIWFTDARPDRVFDQTPMALAVMDQWLTTGQRPATAVDSCFATDGTLIASGPGVWNGVIDGKPAGACTQQFPIHETSRTVAGAPFEGNVFKCRLQPVAAAIARGLYGSWRPDAAQVQRLSRSSRPASATTRSATPDGRPDSEPGARGSGALAPPSRIARHAPGIGCLRARIWRSDAVSAPASGPARRSALARRRGRSGRGRVRTPRPPVRGEAAARRSHRPAAARRRGRPRHRPPHAHPGRSRRPPAPGRGGEPPRRARRRTQVGGRPRQGAPAAAAAAPPRRARAARAAGRVGRAARPGSTPSARMPEPQR